MNFFILVPFFYFYATRLSKGALAFHVLFEWVAAAFVVYWVGVSQPIVDLFHAAICYVAFISLYELGYLGNDLFSIRKELNGTHRISLDSNQFWIAAWIATRIYIFLYCTALLGQWTNYGWWLFFIALGIVFAIHNILADSEMRVSTFPWLAFMRFMAPITFVVQDSQRMGIGLATVMSYVAFRNLGYLDSKGLLKMPKRKSPKFRLFIFLMPMAGVVVMCTYPEAQGFCVLSIYFSLVAALGAFVDSKRLCFKNLRRIIYG